MGWDNGEGAIRRFGSGAFGAGADVVPAAVRGEEDSWRDYFY